MEGYIKLHRRILDSRVWANEGLFKVWAWCLLRANYKDTWVTVKTGRSETEVLVKAGQFIFGRKSAGKSLKMPPSTVWKRILKLENMENLNTERNTHYTIISIVNWDTYQDDKDKGDTEGDRQGTGKEQARNTDKKEKKDKNIPLCDSSESPDQQNLFDEIILPGKKIPKCPQQEIVNLWSELMPEFPQPREWGEERQKALRSRWNSSAERQDLDWWVRFFNYIRKSPFLMGQVDQPGRKTFVAKLDWTVKKANFLKIIEGDYHE